MIKKGLGRGLDAIISNENINESEIREIKITEIENNSDQPRKNFDEESLNQLAESIKQHGVVQPIIVKKENDTYRIVAGERRWRAARIAGLATIPAIIRDVGEREMMEIALIENLQREDLNPIEEAEAYEKLIKEFNATQEEISKYVGKSRPAIANSLRLLTLDKKIKELIIEEKISSGHARALLSIEDEELRMRAAEEIIKKELNVRESERLAKKYSEEKIDKKNKREKIKDEDIIQIEEKLREVLGTKVNLQAGRKKGKITIEYFSSEELNRIVELILEIAEKQKH